jgi:hypothetical protein
MRNRQVITAPSKEVPMRTESKVAVPTSLRRIGNRKLVATAPSLAAEAAKPA